MKTYALTGGASGIGEAIKKHPQSEGHNFSVNEDGSIHGIHRLPPMK